MTLHVYKWGSFLCVLFPFYQRETIVRWMINFPLNMLKGVSCYVCGQVVLDMLNFIRTHFIIIYSEEFLLQINQPIKHTLMHKVCQFKISNQHTVFAREQPSSLLAYRVWLNASNISILKVHVSFVYVVGAFRGMHTK